MFTLSSSSLDIDCPCCCTCAACQIGSDDLSQDEFDPTATGCDTSMEETSLYRDLRSHEKALNRQRKQFQKYYGYREVKPSWINQKYYTLVLVPTSTKNTQSTAQTQGRRSRTKRVSRSRSPPFCQLENEQPQETDRTNLLELRNVCSDNWWLTLYYDNYVSLCASEARTNHPSSCSAPKSLALVNRDLQDLHPPLPQNTTIALTARTWTKTDNFTMKDTGIWPLDRRHHHGKKYREKRNRKWSAKQLKHGKGKRMTPQPLDEEPEELDLLIRRHGAWSEGDWFCCECCAIIMDVDEHFEGEFQDPDEYDAARKELFEDLIVQRIAEGDELWTLMYGRRHRNGDVHTEAGLEMANNVVEDVEVDFVTAVDAVASDEDGDIWVEVPRSPSVMSRSSDFEIVLLSEERNAEVYDDGDDDVDWEMLSTVNE